MGKPLTKKRMAQVLVSNLLIEHLKDNLCDIAGVIVDAAQEADGKEYIQYPPTAAAFRKYKHVVAEIDRQVKLLTKVLRGERERSRGAKD